MLKSERVSSGEKNAGSCSGSSSETQYWVLSMNWVAIASPASGETVSLPLKGGVETSAVMTEMPTVEKPSTCVSSIK